VKIQSLSARKYETTSAFIVRADKARQKIICIFSAKDETKL